MTARFRTLLAGLVALIALPAVASAQGTGTIAGTVTDAETRQPISDVTVFVVGTQRGARTNERGEYRIAGVPAGTANLRFVRIGYAAKTQQVTLQASETVTLDMQLKASLRQLDQVVVTATGETQRKRESGATIGSIAVADQVPLAATNTFSDVLSARTPGVNVASSGGTTGTGQRIRIRGANSVNLSNDPLLIVDGVRVNASSASNSIGVGGQTVSRFDDLNPDDIETIEVIKGPAGVALYGVQAANGVIQVTTKRGKIGKGRWTAFGELGVINNVVSFPDNVGRLGNNRNPATGVLTGTQTIRCALDQQSYGQCVPVPAAGGGDSLYRWNPLQSPITPIRQGNRQQAGLSLTGGSEAAQYYFGADQEKEQGVYDSNRLLRNNVRFNISTKPSDDLKVSAQIGYTQSRLVLPQNDNNLFGVLGGALLGGPIDCSPATPCGTDTVSRGFAAGRPAQTYFNIDTRQDVERFIGSVNLTYTPSKYLTVTAVTGAEQLSRFDNQVTPPNVIPNSADLLAGSRVANRVQIASYTSNLSATSSFAITNDLVSTTTAGAQYVSEIFRSNSGSGIGLLPGTRSLNAVSRNFAVGESNTIFNTFGLFAQQQFAWRDRLFVTAGVRGDDNSAFGSQIGFLTFPTLQGSWVISEEGFFPKQNLVSSLRLRSAIGQSGQRPGFRDAVTFFGPVSVTVNGASVPALTVSGAGNADLRAEKTTEWEAGFEAGFWNDRLVLDLAYFDKRTRDALVGVPLAPSLGSAAARVINVGEVSNKGIEALVTAKIVQERNFGFDLTVNFNTLENRLENLGLDNAGNPIPPIIFGLGGATQRHQNGYPLGGYWDRRLVSFNDLNGDGIISRVNCPGQPAGLGTAAGLACEVTLSDTAEFIGNILPKWEMSVIPQITLFRYVQVTANINHRGDFWQNNSTLGFRAGSSFRNADAAFNPQASLFEQARAISWLMGTRAAYFEKADFTRLRELNIRLTAPKSWTDRLNLQALSLDVAGRNLGLWTKFTGFDPEVNFGGQGQNFGVADFLTQPPVRQWVSRVNITF
jgi:TonB-linked SusC/RagA family outer membrane protein